jgi:flagellar biosynthesis protein FlhG
MPVVVPDQAEGLRRLFARSLVRSVAFVGGEAGIGRSALVANLAVALARRGQSVCVVERDPEGPSPGERLGLAQSLDLAAVIRRDSSLPTIIGNGPEGVRFVRARGAGRLLARLPADEEVRLSEAFSLLDPSVDMLLVDAPMGSGDEAVSCAVAASEIVLVAPAGRDGITHAYALVKRLMRDAPVRRVHLVVTRARGLDHAQAIHDNLSATARRFLSVSVAWLGWVPEDPDMSKALRLHQAVSCAFPTSASALALGEMADTLLHWPYAGEDCLDGFVHRLVQASRTLLSANA